MPDSRRGTVRSPRIRLTWGEFKALVEAVDGVTDETEIEYFDINDFLDREINTRPDSQLMARLLPTGRLVVD